MIAKTLNNNSCVICGIPLDAECFDASGVAVARGPLPVDHPFQIKQLDLSAIPLIPARGEQIVLASIQLHPQYCGLLTYFAQYTDLYAADNVQILTPGFEWSITQNGKPVFPYTRLELIVNPWGANCLPIAVRLDENARVEFILRNRSVSDLAAYPIKSFAGRILGRYWYNESFGGRNLR
jgi:hypothetical protein